MVNYLDISGAELSISNCPFEQMKGGRRRERFLKVITIIFMKSREEVKEEEERWNFMPNFHNCSLKFMEVSSLSWFLASFLPPT